VWTAARAWKNALLGLRGGPAVAWQGLLVCDVRDVTDLADVSCEDRGQDPLG
jgi:hypothetical protein